MFTYDGYGAALIWKHPNAILTHNYGSIEVWSSRDCCSWYNIRSCHHLCDIKLKGGVRDRTTLVTRKNRLNNTKRWNTPLMCKRGNCTCKCHILPRTWSFHTGLQLSTWSWRWTMNNTQGYIKNTNRILRLYHVVTYGSLHKNTYFGFYWVASLQIETHATTCSHPMEI